MDEFGNIFRSITKTSRESRIVYLDVLDESQCLQGEKNVAAAAQSIGSLLAKASSRSIGLRFLIAYLNQCSVDVLEKKGALWLTLVMKACNKKEIRLYGELIYEAIALFVKRMQSTPDLSKVFATTHLSKLFESLCLLENSENKCGTIAALRAVKQSLKLFPGPSKFGKAPVMRFLVKLIDSSDPDVVHQSGACWLLLQQVRGAGNNAGGLNDKTQWRDFQLGLLGSLHDLLNVAFEKCNDMYDGPVATDKLEYLTMELAGDPIQRAAQVCRRFCNIVEILKITLSKPFPAKKPIYPKKILNIIERGLGVTCASFELNHNIDNICFATLLPQMHTKLFELLEVLINICHVHLRMHFRLILSLIVDSLKFTKVPPQEAGQKLFVNLRSTVFRVTSLWCSILKEGSRVEIIAEHLIHEILQDVLPRRSDLALVSLKNSSKQSAKRTQKDMRHLKSQTFVQKEGAVKKGNQYLCRQALLCLQEVFFASGHLIKPPVIKVVHSKIIMTCAQFYELSIKEENLYSNPHCRLEIYNALFALITSTNHRYPPPTETILNILKVSCTSDKNSDIRKCCQNLIQIIEKSLHPHKESFIFPMDLQDMTNASSHFDQEDKGTEISNQNSRCEVDELIPTNANSNNENYEMISNIENNEINSCNENNGILVENEKLPEPITHSQKSSLEEINGNNESATLINTEQSILVTSNKVNEDEDVISKCIDEPECMDLSDTITRDTNSSATMCWASSNDVTGAINNCTKPSDDNEFIAELEAAFINELK